MFPPAVTVSLVLLTSFPCLPHETWFTVRKWRFKNWRWRIPGNEATSPYSVLFPLLPQIMSAIHIISGASKLGLWVHTNCAWKQQQLATINIRLETVTVTWGGVVTYLCLKMNSNLSLAQSWGCKLEYSLRDDIAWPPITDTHRCASKFLYHATEVKNILFSDQRVLVTS